MPTVGIIIPTHNRADLLPAAVESAKHAGSDVEIVVVDDGSTDKTPEVCGRLSGIRYIRLPHNQGLACARNAGIIGSSAEFVTFLDDDDVRLPNSLDSQISALEASPNSAFCYGRVLIADASHHRLTGEIIPKQCPAGDIFWNLLEQNFVPVMSVVARRQSLIDCNMFSIGVNGVEDWDLWLRLTEVSSVVAIEEPVAIYRRANRTSGQMCSDSVSMYRHMLLVQEKALQLPRATAAPRAKRRRTRLKLVNLAYDALVQEARTALVEGDREGARATSREAKRLRPFRARLNLALLRL